VSLKHFSPLSSTPLKRNAKEATQLLVPQQPCVDYRKAMTSDLGRSLSRSSLNKIAQAIIWRSSLLASLSIECMSTQCIFCLGNDELSTPRRLWSFSSHGDWKLHFYRKHLRHHPNKQSIARPRSRCNIDLMDKMHLQNHAKVVHKTFT